MSNAIVPSKQARDTLVQAVGQWKPWIEKVLPKHIGAERMFKVINLAMTRQPDLWTCDQKTVVQAVLTAAQLGLDVGGALGSAYLVPYKNVCTLIVGYRGLIDLARRSGQILTIEAHVVWSNDEFELVYGTDPRLIHRPAMTRNYDGDTLVDEIMGAYAVAFLRDGGKQTEYMSKQEINRIGSGRGPWKDHWSEMARKTVVRRLCKYLPLSPELSTAIAVDDDAEQGLPPTIDVEPEAQPQEEPKPGRTVTKLAAAADKARAEDREPGADDGAGAA